MARKPKRAQRRLLALVPRASKASVASRSRDAPSRSRDTRCASFVVPLDQKGAGNAESWPPPMARLQTKTERGAVTTVQPDPPGHSLRDGFNGFLCAPPGTGLSCPCRSRDHHLARLTPASGCQGHTTSPSALRLRSSSRNSCVHRSSASPVVTIAIRPSSIEAGCAKHVHISEKRKQDFSQQNWTVESALDRRTNFDFSCMRSWPSRGARPPDWRDPSSLSGESSCTFMKLIHARDGCSNHPPDRLVLETSPRTAVRRCAPQESSGSRDGRWRERCRIAPGRRDRSSRRRRDRRWR
jgi:hypothetical protein